MRVIHVITRLIVGGAQENTISSVLGLSSKPDLQLKLISGPSLGPEGSLEHVAKVSPGLLSIVPELVRPIRPWRDLVAYLKLLRLFKSEQPRIVHTHSGKAGILGRLAAAHAKVPIIIHTIHGPSFGPFQGELANLVFRSAERVAGRVTTHFVCVADAMKEQYLKASIGSPDQYTTIRSGFDLQPFLFATNSEAIRARFGLSPQDIVVGKIARLFKLKGHDDLFAVAPTIVRACPRVRFLLVGDGEWRGKFQEMARSLGLERHFVFTGLVSPREIPDLLGIMDVLVHLSRREGLARALPQALAAARPIVAYNCDGASEVCLDRQTGFLVTPGNLEQLQQRLIELIQDVNLRERLGSAGRQLVRESFTIDRMVDDLYQLYLQLNERLARKREMAPTQS